MNDKALNLLGLACRAGKAVCGDGSAQKILKKRRVPLLFLASDGGSDNVGKYRRLAERKGITVIDTYTKDELGSAVGRAQSVIILIDDKGFAAAIEKVKRDE
ncbi:ribosomal L7Ae/L30e/S12e/Gadd45 family protein [uncultured Megasphaera sp.]|uniref:L7Ae/L30e/S12e/Gadd45 family ribosomal protein n=1 Tax=Megasphaera sp. TaxID=2023260 RepID=UPI00260157C0|nr:ribosomal L7Ae/L30e/S12e/Gadd45 family protein [uncultured Megasphaera sp.]